MTWGLHMTKTGKGLTAVNVATSNTPGMYPDGRGLYLQVYGPTSKSWLYRFTIAGKTRSIGLGSARDGGLSLAAARAKRDELRALVVRGIDPLAEKKAAKAESKIQAAKNITFADATKEYLAAHRAGWRNIKHATQWDATLRTYAGPIIGALPVSEVDTATVLNVLRPIWNEKTETANRVRGRIEAILDWAKAREFRAGENPARWRGHLSMLLPSRAKVRAVEHHAALPYAEIGAFMADLRTREGMSALALEFAILTAARTSETLGATWQEMDLKANVWTIPGTRMKSGREHRVPLSPATLAVLSRVRETTTQHAHIFPNLTRGRPLSNMAMLKQLERMKLPDLTVHGFRSTFRDWAADRTNYPGEVAEMALAHAIGDKVEAAYRRGDLFDKRRRLMNDWADFCAQPAAETGSVVPIRAAQA